MANRTRQHVSRPARRAFWAAGWIAAWAAVGGVSAISPAADEKTATVRLVVDYGDGAQVRLTSLPWRGDMTVLDALAAAQKHPHGIKFSQRGSGTNALIIAIDDLKNEGDGKNWLYSVNGETAKVGAGAYKLKPGDAILWEFKVYEYN